LGFKEEWNKTKASRKKLSKMMKKGIKTAGNSRQKASDWIVNNINPGVYDLGIDIDPWNLYGTSSKKKSKKKKRR
jgi:hypothetical protein